ncbi:MAG TPA: MinD/ParA family protein [Candidatus Limnocylindrales bacterium]|nr:MinD/ParA family protein [Candidatus Limnocylindrales bacterium]
MPTILSVHSFRGGTGKSNTTANLAGVLAERGLRVGVIDTDIQSPGIHVLFGLDGEDVHASLNDYLWHDMPIREVAMDVSGRVGLRNGGQLFLIPSSMKPGEITRILREGYDAQRLTAGIRDLVSHVQLDVLLIDTHPGLNEETLLSLVLSDALLIVMRPDKQDFEGTGITARVAKELEVPRVSIVVNKTPTDFDPDAVAQRVTASYDCEVAAVLPHSDDLMRLGSEGIFVLRHPDHELSARYRQLAERLLPRASFVAG